MRRSTASSSRRSPADRKSTRLNSSHTDIYPLSLHDALPICRGWATASCRPELARHLMTLAAHATFDCFFVASEPCRSEEHTSELQSHRYIPSFPTRRSSDLPGLGYRFLST